MKNPWIRTFLLAGMLAATTDAIAQKAQLITLPLSRPGEPIKLDIEILSAHIEVIGEARDDAQFEISVGDSDRKIITPSGAKSIRGGGYTLEVEEDDNHISVDADWRAHRADVLARIPRRADLYLATVNDGEIIVSDISGNLELQNTNGPITARNISGSVIAESINDTIDIGFSRIDDVSATSFESINGDLILSLPANAGVRLFLDTARGEMYSDFEVEVEPTEPTIERKEQRGGVEVRIENVIIATINGGGPAVRLKTLQGDIHIRKLP